MALPDSTQNQPVEQSNSSLVQTCFKQEVMIQNYAQFTHRISALEVISAALAVKAADGAHTTTSFAVSPSYTNT